MSTVKAISVNAKANTASLNVMMCSNFILGVNALADKSNNSVLRFDLINFVN
ncbi:hypothetical protein YTPLAS21_01470 [Candidatus Nitrosocosmicus sp.]|jgi:hypothetical protein|nr:hypothetical protein YTPLAS21_01080 [Candidatus Nitrosocosmicus sp.]GKS60689.1 hypothetical protein YTPLAS21_01470 [Candidatus Nitrosocosmicus sp.]